MKPCHHHLFHPLSYLLWFMYYGMASLGDRMSQMQNTSGQQQEVYYAATVMMKMDSGRQTYSGRQICVHYEMFV